MENTILIIEDDANTAALITLYCEREGFRTLVADNGLSGLEKASKEQPHLVILDLMLPDETLRIVQLVEAHLISLPNLYIPFTPSLQGCIILNPG